MAQDEKLNKSLQLNMRLLRQINFSKAGSRLKTLVFYKIAEMAVLLFMMVYLWNFIVQNITLPGFCIPAFIITGFITAGFISDIRQVVLVSQIRTNPDAPVSILQKKTEKLKLLIINYVKASLISIPFYPVFIIVAGKIFLNVDFWMPQHRLYILCNLIVGALLVPLFTWLYKQLSDNNLKQVWINNLLTGSGWNQAVQAQQFLSEIEEFQQEA